MNNANARRMGVYLVNNTNFEKMLQRFYSSTNINTTGDNRCVREIKIKHFFLDSH